LINEEYQIDNSNESLDDSEKAGCEETGIRAGNSNTLENSRGVVVDRVDSRPVLPEK
jgi:hypothetical protein